MTNIDDRIAQWEKMTREVPDGMAFFSLGNAYREKGRYEDAATALREAVRLDENLSRGYQLLGQILILLKQEGEAGPVLTRGFHVAAERGDVMPKRAIASLLEKLELPVPEVDEPQPQEPVVADGESIVDRRTGQRGARIAESPMRGPLGRFVVDHFSQETWQAWIGQGTKVINELRLDFSNQEHQKAYDEQMMEWLGISEQEIAEHWEKVGGDG